MRCLEVATVLPKYVWMILTCVGRHNEIKGVFEWCVYFGNRTRASTYRVSCHKKCKYFCMSLSSCSTLAQILFTQILNDICAVVEHEIERHACDSQELALQVRVPRTFSYARQRIHTEQTMTYIFSCFQAHFVPEFFVGNDILWTESRSVSPQ
jgi:hypothetical protein